MRADSGFTASWWKVETPDAGTDPTPALAGFEVVDLDASGALVRRELVASPPELRAKKGSIEGAGIARENGATLTYWLESVLSTEPDGRVRTAFALRTAYGDRVLVPAAAACEKCVMNVAVVAFGDETIAIVRTEPDVVLDVELGKPQKPPVFSGVRLRRDGSAASTPLPFLSIERTPRQQGGRVIRPAPLSAVRDIDGQIALTTDGRAWRLDRALLPVASPIELPATDARALWGPADPVIAWSTSPTEEGRSTAQFTRREIFQTSGAIRERLSHGRRVLGAERRGDEVGVVFESTGRVYFAASSASARKRGGDVFVRMIDEVGSQFGEYEPDDATLVVSPSAGRFTVVDIGRGKLQSTEIVCAP